MGIVSRRKMIGVASAGWMMTVPSAFGQSQSSGSPSSQSTPSSHLQSFAMDGLARLVAKQRQGTATSEHFKQVAEHSRIMARHCRMSGIDDAIKQAVQAHVAAGKSIPTDYGFLDTSSAVSAMQVYDPTFTRADLDQHYSATFNSATMDKAVAQATSSGISSAFDEIADHFFSLSQQSGTSQEAVGFSKSSHHRSLRRDICVWNKALCAILSVLGLLALVGLVAAGCTLAGPAAWAICATLGSNFAYAGYAALIGLAIALCDVLASETMPTHTVEALSSI